MTALKRIIGNWLGWLRQRKIFWTILLLYLAGSVLLLTIFSAVLTVALTRNAAREAVARNRDALGQAYAAANYVLNSTYDSYYNLYQSSEATELMFADAITNSDALAAKAMLEHSMTGTECVASVYLINKKADWIYSTEGGIYTFDTFYDQQAMRLFRFYNESSNTLFLPRTAIFAQESATEQTHSYISLVFSLRDAFMQPAGGIIVNIDEKKLATIIAGDLETAEDLYVISENGSILANTDPSKVNTSLNGSQLWEKITAHAGEENFTFSSDFEGVPCLVTGRNAPRLRFCFLRITPQAQLARGVHYIRTVVLICAGFFMGIALLLSGLASRHIYSPIYNFVTGLRVRTQSDTGSDVTAHPVDEITFLDSTYRNLFDKMDNLSRKDTLMEQAGRQEVLVHLLYGEYHSEEKCRAEADRTDILPGEVQRLVVLLQFDHFAALTQKCTTQEISLFRYALCNVAEELLGAKGTVLCTELGSDQVAAVVPQAMSDALPEIVGEINTAMEQHLHCTVTAGIGVATGTLQGISSSFKTATAALGYRLTEGCGAAIFHDLIAARSSDTPEYPMDLDAAIVQAMRSRSKDKTFSELETFFDVFAKADADSINMATTQLTISLSRVVHGMPVALREYGELINYRTLSAKINACDTLAERRSLLENYCAQVIELRNREVKNKKDTLIERIQSFIEENYTNPMLNAEDIAACADLSANYLRTVFKAATGKSPADSLTDFRIAKAQELLVGTNLTTKEIATAVGYYNHRYFYSVFKAKTGQTATAYRIAARKNTDDSVLNKAKAREEAEHEATQEEAD